MVVAANSTEPTVFEQVATEFERLPDPTTTTTAPSPPGETTTTCVPAGPAAAPEFSGDTSRYDPSTVGELDDPTPDGCVAATRLLVLGDSTGRGAANGLRRVAPPGLEVWDRSELGCGMQTADSDCPEWRELWSNAVAEVDPDVVLVHLGISEDLVPGVDPPFMSGEASELRRRQMTEAASLLGAGGARVAWILPAVPLDNGVFYCGGRRTDSGCDPRWIDRWNEDLAAVAASTGVQLVDVEGWVRGRGNDPADRPDGLHLSGPALDAQATWLAEQLR
jgi:lysophospholipase L1-like esterase